MFSVRSVYRNLPLLLILITFLALFGCTQPDTFILKKTTVVDGNVSGEPGEVPFVGPDGNQLMVQTGFDFNSDTNTLNVSMLNVDNNIFTKCITLSDGNVYCSANDFPSPNLTGYSLINSPTNLTIVKTAPRLDFNINSSTLVGSFGASDPNNLQFSRNAFFDGVNWQRTFTNQYSLITQLLTTTTSGEYQIYGSAPAGNPITNFAKIFALDIVRRNFSVGVGAGKALTTGIDNAFFGTNAGEFVTTGNRNIAFGELALSRITTASNNVALGYYAGQLLNAGSGNSGSADSIFIGRDTRSALANQQNEIVIGRGARGKGSNTVVLGASDIVLTQLQGDVNVPKDLNVYGTVYANAYEGLSPFAFTGDTRMCRFAVNGKVVYEQIEFISGEYKSVIREDTTGLCSKTVLKSSVTDQNYFIVDGVPQLVTITENVFEEIWSKERTFDREEVYASLPVYVVGQEYFSYDVFVFNGELYEVLQTHISQSDWLPNLVPALYKVRVLQEYGEIREWIQPTHAGDSYMIGDKVLFNGQVYESLINNNVWSPAVYPQGWKLV
jgi:hypothetical protein